MRTDRDDLSDVISDDTKPVPSRRGDVLSGPERRRRWSAAEKLAIVKESFEEGAVVSHVAHRHGLSPQQLFGWRREIREQVLGGDIGPEGEGASCQAEFVPIAVARTAPIPGVMAMTEAPAQTALSATIEIELSSATIRLMGAVDARSLAIVLKALKVLR
jgi:transposase